MPLKLNAFSGGSVTLNPASTASDFTLTVPAVTDTIVGATATQTLTNKTLTTPTVSGSILNSSGRPMVAQAGGILQVVTARTGAFFSSSSTSWVDITGLSLTITPASTSSRIFLMMSLGRATTSNNTLDFACGIRILGNGSDDLNINGSADGSRPRMCMNTIGLAFNSDHSVGGWTVSSLEFPATTSAVTYRAQVQCQLSDRPFIMNGSPNNSNTNNIYHGRTSSSLTAFEVAQ